MSTASKDPKFPMEHILVYDFSLVMKFSSFSIILRQQSKNTQWMLKAVPGKWQKYTRLWSIVEFNFKVVLKELSQIKIYGKYADLYKKLQSTKKNKIPWIRSEKWRQHISYVKFTESKIFTFWRNNRVLQKYEKRMLLNDEQVLKRTNRKSRKQNRKITR